ncbi:hypothetical protein BHM03_00001101 [Ensete ventricosum]|uniref:Uncharacterized protein n=1 Tax=Ensete ventricosum TaxID=4639 RepID=A0A445M8Y5_ENSVE|nr:hypothetical protein BHM03_00001101 [Ensete ventricosum]
MSAAKSKGKPKVLVPTKPKTKPKSRLAVVRPEGAATSPMPKVPTRSAKPAKTSAKEESWSPRTPLCWRPNSNPSSPSLCEGPHREERWRRAPMATKDRGLRRQR